MHQNATAASGWLMLIFLCGTNESAGLAEGRLTVQSAVRWIVLFEIS